MKKFIAGSNYLAAIESAISSAKKIDIAVAFWGHGSETLFSKSSAKKRIICNLGTGGTNPTTIKALDAQFNTEVKNNNKLHAKVILADSILIVGSANFSINGLHLEGEELFGWNEAAIATDDPETISSAKAWFQTQWDESRDISSQDLSDAEALWQRSRANRIHDNSLKFQELSQADLTGRNIVVVLWMDDASDEAYKQYVSIKQGVEALGASGEKLDFYEDWDSLPVDAYLIDAKIGPKRGVTINGIYIRCPELDPANKFIQIVRQISDFGNLPFKWDRSFQSSLSKAISKNIPTNIENERYSKVNLIEFISN